MKTLFLIIGFLIFTGCASQSAKIDAAKSPASFQKVLKKDATILQKGSNKYSCAICGMDLVSFYRTNHAANTKNGVKQYCSLHCLVYDNEINHTDLMDVKVIDANSLKFISALKAWYVTGSKMPATMSAISKYAFSTKKAATSFAKKYGGEVMRFYDAYDIAIKDFTKK